MAFIVYNVTQRTPFIYEVSCIIACIVLCAHFCQLHTRSIVNILSFFSGCSDLFWQVQVIVKNICITLIEISGRVTVAVERVFLNAICAIYEAVGSGGILHLVEKVADAMEVSIDQLVYGDQDNKAEQSISDRELLSMFKKVQLLSERQKETVKDFLTSYIFTNDLKQKLA